jgi:GntR family transcriptional regulator, phosphonate transport system regulatory protein
MRHLSTPRYLQLADRIEAALSRGEWRAGERLPPDRQLAREHEVNRHTIARALEHLQRKGLVARVKGHGTFVSPGRLDYRIAAEMSFSNSVARLGMRNRQRVLSVQRHGADAPIAEQLRIPVGSTIVTLERVRYAGDIPLALLRMHYADAVVPGLERHLSKFLSTRAAIRHRYGLDVVRARLEIEIEPADATIARHLGVPIGAPLLQIASLDTLTDGTPVEYGHTYFRGDAARLQVALHGSDV